MFAGTRSGRNGSSAKRSATESNLYLNGWVASGINDFSSVYFYNLGHDKKKSEFVIKKRSTMPIIIEFVKILREKEALWRTLLLAFDQSLM